MNDSPEGDESPGPDFLPPSGGARDRGSIRPRRAAAPGQLSQPPAREGPSRAPAAPPEPAGSDPGTTTAAGRWGEALAGVGLGLIGVVAVQVLMAVIAGFLLEQTAAGATGIHHRLGVPFGSLGGATALLLTVGLALQAAPVFGGRDLSARQKKLLRVAIPAASALALAIVIGSVLAVVTELNELTLRGVNASGYLRIQLATFLAGGIGVPAVTIAAAGAARRLT